MNLKKRMLRNIKKNPMMFKDFAAAALMATNPKKTAAAVQGKDYTGGDTKGGGKGLTPKSFSRMLKTLGYDYGSND